MQEITIGKVELRSRETIKPSSPTPHELQLHKLSLLDQHSPPGHLPMLFYYAADDHGDSKMVERASRMKMSLSENLDRFYPVAGRIQVSEYTREYIICNDEGIDYFEAQVNCSLSKILNEPEAHIVDQLLPHDFNIEVQLAIQLNLFTCGGMAIGVCLSHLLFDASSLSLFINGWAAITRGNGESLCPIFLGASLFPPSDTLAVPPSLQSPQVATKRFVFDGSKIAVLKAKVANSGLVDQPSRSVVLSALIWKCAIEVPRVKLGCTASLAVQSINLRPRAIPPMPKNSVGNLIWLALASSPVEYREAKLEELASKIKTAIREFDATYAEKLQGEEGFSVVSETFKQINGFSSKGAEIYWFSSSLNFPFHEADFGWGKPVWVSSASMPSKNAIFLFNSKSGNGVEAWITLDENDMPIFERNIQELLDQVSSNGSISSLLLASKL